MKSEIISPPATLATQNLTPPSQGVNSASPLDQLPPLMLPDPVGWWPPAPGWWLVMVLILGVLIAGTLWMLQRIHAGRARRAALALATQQWDDYLQRRSREDSLEGAHGVRQETTAHDNTTGYLFATVQLIRRFCQQQYPQLETNQLSGEQWLHQLDAIVRKNLFDSPQGQVLISIYRADQHTSFQDAEQLHNTVIQWLRSAPLHTPNLEQLTQTQHAGTESC